MTLPFVGLGQGYLSPIPLSHFQWISYTTSVVKLTDLSQQTSTLGLRGIQACGGDVRLTLGYLSLAIPSETGKPVREDGKPMPITAWGGCHLDAITSGNISTMLMSSPGQIPGNIPGIWPSTAFLLHWSIQSLLSINYYYSCVSGTCIPMVSCLLMNGPWGM